MHESFIQAIAAAVDDDTPRLVYADYLEENGDPARAELIRVQCELARLGWPDDRRPPLQARESVLVAEHSLRWRAALPQFEGLEWGRCPVRGFYEGIAVREAAVLRDHGRAVRDASPVTSLFLEPPATSADVAGLPFLEGITSLKADFDAGPRSGAAVLARSEYATTVRHLDLTRSVVGGKGLIALLASPHLTSLRTLYLLDAAIDGRDLRPLPAARINPGLRDLDLGFNPLGNVGVRALASCRSLDSLERLNLYRSGVRGRRGIGLGRRAHSRTSVLGAGRDAGDGRRGVGPRPGPAPPPAPPPRPARPYLGCHRARAQESHSWCGDRGLRDRRGGHARHRRASHNWQGWRSAVRRARA